MVPGRRKRAQVAVACENCRRHKSKCDGARPTCQRCESNRIECRYSVPWSDAPPIVAIKRQHSELQERSANEHNLLQQLRSLTRPEAHRLLDVFRESNNSNPALQCAHDTPIPLSQIEGNSQSCRNQDLDVRSLTHTSKTTFGIDLTQNPQVYTWQPDLVVRQLPHSSEPPFFRILPSFSQLTASLDDSCPNLPPQPPSGASFQRSLNPPSPSHPQIQDSAPSPQIPNFRHDDRLKAAFAADWGVFYIDDEAFRNIICSYLVWDHPAWRFFDEDDFLDGLRHAPSVTCSPALVHAIIAFGSKNYSWVDPRTAETAGIRAAAEAEMLWRQEDPGQESLATSAAGILLWNNNGVLGRDNTGDQYVRRVKQTLGKGHFYNRESYCTPVFKVNRARAIFIWGIYSWLAFCEVTLGASYGLCRRPPDVTYLCKGQGVDDDWMPWPRDDRRVPALTGDVFLARCSVMTVLMDIVALQKRHSHRDPSLEYLKDCFILHDRLQQLWDSEIRLFFLERATPHLLLLHCWYHYAVLQVLRPFVAAHHLAMPNLRPLAKTNTSSARAISISQSSSQKLHRLLIHGSRMFAGLQAPVIFSQIAVVIAIDMLPSASALGKNFSASAATAFTDALYVLHGMGKAFIALRFALLGIRQRALQMQIIVSDEGSDIFARVESEYCGGGVAEPLNGDWVLGMELAGDIPQTARLQSLKD